MKTVLPLISISLLLGSLMTGCSNKKAPIVQTQAKPKWNWSQYRQSERFQLALLPADLSAARMVRYIAPANGMLNLNIDAMEVDLEEGFVWALMDQDSIRSEDLAIRLMEKNLEMKDRQAETMEYPKQRLDAERALEEGRRKLELMRMVHQDPELLKLASEHMDASVTEVNDLAIRRSEEEVSILEATLASVLEKIEGDNLESEGKRVELEKRKNEFEQKKRQSEMKAPFAGRLAANFQLSGDKRDFMVANNQELGVLRDVSKLQFSLPITHSSWLQLSPEAMEIISPQGLDEPLIAKYDYQRIEQKSGMPEQRIYTFSLNEQQSRTSYKLIGSRLQVELWITLDQPAYLVPKIDVAMYAEDQIVGRRWDEAVDMLFPGARLAAEGQTHLAIILAKDAQPDA